MVWWTWPAPRAAAQRREHQRHHHGPRSGRSRRALGQAARGIEATTPTTVFKLLAERNVEAVIPTTRGRRAPPIPHDSVAYRRRNTVERLWARLKDFRRVATRYDKLAANFLAGVIIAAIVAFWIK